MPNKTKKYSHCFPHDRERHITSVIAYCGHFNGSKELFNQPEGEPCPICETMHDLRMLLLDEE